jgi:hypothetical protein
LNEPFLDNVMTEEELTDQLLSSGVNSEADTQLDGDDEAVLSDAAVSDHDLRERERTVHAVVLDISRLDRNHESPEVRCCQYSLIHSLTSIGVFGDWFVVV